MSEFLKQIVANVIQTSVTCAFCELFSAVKYLLYL